MASVQVHIDLYRDLRQWFIDELTRQGYKVPPTVKHDEVGIMFFNVLKRRIARRVRRVHKSKELSARKLAPDHNTALGEIEAASIAGSDLNPRLSTKLLKANYHDDMLNDWGFHHLHLGLGVMANGFVERDGPLLYAKVTDDALYFIDVRDHGHWSNSELFEIVEKNWPETIARHALKGLTLAGPPISDEERERLRKAGVFVLTPGADGQVYMPPGGGAATSRTSVEAVTRSDQKYRLANAWEETCKARADDMLALVNSHSGKTLTELHFSLFIGRDGKFCVKETQTDVLIRSDDDLKQFYAIAASDLK